MTNEPQQHYNQLLGVRAEDRMQAARVVLPLIMDAFGPRSLLDIGCGHGAWLRVARELGVEQVYGVDGPWIETESLLVPQDCFSAQSLDQPCDLSRRFDLVMSLEVAEHVPEAAADTFVDSVVRHGDIVLFSAAVPGQGGHGHVNEQWPGYWAAKFAAHGYKVIDAIRPLIWGDPSVFWWLRQNTLLFMNDTALDRYTEFRDDIVDDFDSLAIIHPELYVRWVRLAQQSAAPSP